MHIDDHAAHDGRADADEHQRRQVGPLPGPVDDGQDGIQPRHDDTAQRNDAGDGKLDQKDDQQRQHHHRGGGQDGARAYQNALAALEAEVNRQRVADDRKDAGQVSAADRLDAGAGQHPRKDQTAEDDRHGPLGHIAHRGGGAGGLAVVAQHVGHARAAAAVGAHIVVAEVLGDQNAEHDAAQKISLGRHKNTGRDQFESHGKSSSNR